MRFLHRTFRPCRRTRRPTREVAYEDCIDSCALPAGADLYSLWAEWISQLHLPAAPGKSTGNPVLCCRQRIPLCRVLFRLAGPWWAAIAFGLLRAACPDSVGGGALQHPCVSLDACAGDHCSGSGGFRAVGIGLPSVPGQLQEHLQREACDPAMTCVAAIATESYR